MANDKEIKIKVVIDDSQEKKYYSESESRRKKSTTQETEEERRKTALLKSQLDEKYANLKSHLNREEEIIKQGNRLEIKAAIEKRKVLESELRTFEKEHKASLQRQNFDYFEAKRKQAREQASYNTKFARQKMLPEMGSSGFLSSLVSEQRRFSAGSTDWNNLEVMIQGTRKELKAAGVDVSSFSQKIGGELNNSLKANVSNLLSTSAAYLGLGIAVSRTTQFVAESVQEYMKQETALRTLTFAVEKVKGMNNEVTQSLVEFADEQQNLTGINDEAIEQSQAYLVLQGRTEEQIKELIKVAIDLSAVQGDLSNENVINNIEKLDATYEGVTGKLGKYDSRIKDLTQAQLENGDAVRILGQKFKGTADEVNKGTEGAWRKWRVGLSESKEVIGGIVVTLVTLNQKFSDWATGASKKLQDLLSQLVGFRTEAEKEYILNFRADGLEQMKQDVLSAIDIIQKKYNESGLKLVGNTKEPEAESGTKSRETTSSRNTGSRNKTVKEIEEQLNLIKKLEEDLAKAQKRLEANRGEIGAERDIRAEILEIEKKIYYYRTGQVNDTPFKMRSPVDDLMEWQSGFKPKGVGRNPRWNNDANDLTPEEVARRQEETYGKILGYTDGMFNNFTGMLEATGLMSNDVQSFVSFIQNAVKFLNSSGGLVQDVIGFFGSVFGAPSTEGGTGSGGFMNPMSGGMPGSVMYRNSITVEAIPNEYLEYKITSKGNAEIARRGTGVY